MTDTPNARKRIRYFPGDYFLIPFADGTAGVGRILLDVFRIRKKAGWPQENHLMGMVGGGLLVGYSERIFPSATLTLSDIEPDRLSLTEYIDHRDILQGNVQIIGHRPVEPDDLNFPEYVSGIEMKYFWQKGLISKEVPGVLGQNRRGRPTAGVSIINGTIKRLLKMGRSPAQIMDLRFSEDREKLIRATGFRPGMSYDEMVGSDGWTTARILKLQNDVIPNSLNRVNLFLS